MTFLTKFSLRNAAAVFIISFLLILGGIFSFSRLKVDLLPNIEFPQVSVELIYPGASPQDVNEKVVSQLEEKMKGIDGIKQIKSSAFDSVGIINLEFPFDTDLDKVEQNLNTIIKDATLPETVQTNINRFSFGSFPIFNMSLFSTNDENIQSLVEDKLVPELKRIPGVNNVSVGGIEQEVLQITVDKEKAAKAGLSLSAIRDTINNSVFGFPAGTVNDNDIQVPVKLEERTDTIKKLKDLQVGTATVAPAPTPEAETGPPTGPPAKQNVATPKPILLSDIAKVETVITQEEYTRSDMVPALSMAITKKQDANTVEVAEKVINVLDDYKKDISYKVAFDSAEGITKSVEALVKEGLLGALFASIAVLLFLRNIRATIIAIVSIPLSLLIAVIFLNQFDITLNIMTLGGMAVAVGRVVDDSIVVIENIFRRVRKSSGGMTNEIIEKSTKEILKAITSSTLTTVVVFLPIGFVGGITGKFFLPFALTVVFSLLASLLVAITIVPILARFSFTKVPKEEKEGALARLYGRTIEVSLNHKIKILVASFLLLVGSFSFVGGLGFVFIPNESEKTLSTSIALPASTSLERSNEVSLEVEKLLDQTEDITDVSTAVGSRDFATGLKRSNQFGYFINLKDDVDLATFVPELEKSIDKIVQKEEPGTKISIQELTSGPPSNNNVTIDLFSTNLEDLQTAAKDIEQYMLKNENLKYVTNNFTEKQRQVIVQVDTKKAKELGVSNFATLGIIADQTTPVTIKDFKLDGKTQNIQLAYDKDLKSIKELEDITIFTARGPVSLTDFAKVVDTSNFTSIQKLDGKVYAQISATIKGNDIRTVSNEVIEGVKTDVELPNSVNFEGGGGSDETLEIFQSLGLAIVVAIGLVYLTMLITFGQARIPFIILSSLLFVPIGSFFALFIAKEPISVSVMIGLLMLIGIVTTNAIVLVDRIGQNRDEKGMMIRDALVEAGKTRLRPILMTAFATIAALIPLALTTSAGTIISKGLAITVIGGLTTSTLLTLIIVPVMYELFFYKKVKAELNTSANVKA